MTFMFSVSSEEYGHSCKDTEVGRELWKRAELPAEEIDCENLATNRSSSSLRRSAAVFDVVEIRRGARL
ncbi:unnamed protein product [Nippostrongylus brasiliensis]|uniref:Uncharacterized protein n=1 Tax=Nippostrongylus brasiliensis TaxID=27835 RepID=A0A0N4YC49_NIPBR|nr:unnamed protein product [Nippostrongylus brasiliensis]